eukprot:1112666-Prymnesium_polylepis.1
MGNRDKLQHMSNTTQPFRERRPKVCGQVGKSKRWSTSHVRWDAVWDCVCVTEQARPGRSRVYHALVTTRRPLCLNGSVRV